MYYIVVCTLSEAMEQQNCRTPPRQESSVIRKVVVPFFLSLQHTHVNIPTGSAWIWFRLERELREWTRSGSRRQWCQISYHYTKVFSLLFRDCDIHGRGEITPSLFLFLRHLIGRVLKTSSNGFNFEREISTTAISKAASKNRLVISTWWVSREKWEETE